MVGGGFIHAAAAPGGGAGLLQLGALGGEADFGEAQEDEAEDGAGVFLGLEAGVGAELVGGIPEALFERGGGGVFFGWGDPVHGQSHSIAKSPRWWAIVDFRLPRESRRKVLNSVSVTQRFPLVAQQDSAGSLPAPTPGSM